MSHCPRAAVHDVAVGFRVNEALFTATEQRARREGMTMSELIRHALRRELRKAD